MEHCLFYGADCVVVRPKKHPDRWKKRTYVVLLTNVEIFRSKRESSIMHSKEEMNGKEICSISNARHRDLHALEARYHVVVVVVVV